MSQRLQYNSYFQMISIKSGFLSKHLLFCVLQQVKMTVITDSMPQILVTEEIALKPEDTRKLTNCWW